MAIQSRFRILVAVLGLAAAGLSTQAYAQTAACTGGGKISKQIAKPMKAADDAQKARKWQEVLAKVREAEADPVTKTEFDLYWMHEYRGYAYLQLGQHAESAREWEASVASPCKPEAGKGETFKQLANLFFRTGNYPKSIDYANRGLAIRRDPELLQTLARAYYQTRDYKKALTAIREVIDGSEKSGRVAKEPDLQFAVSICARLNDAKCEAQLYEKLVQHYPKPEYWQHLLSSLIAGDSKDEVKIHVMRLAYAVDVMKDPEQFKEMAVIALDQGLPAEAESVISKGKAAKIFTEKRDIEYMDRLLVRAKAEAASGKAGLSKREMVASAAPSGDLLVKLGASYLSYGNYDQAISALKRAIAKPNLTLKDEAAMLLGITYRRAGNKVEAGKTFRTVSQDPTMVRIAKLWLLSS